MIPGAGVTIKHRRRLDALLPVRSASFAFKGIMRIGCGVGLKLKEFAKAVEREVTFDVFCRVDDTGGQRLLVRLALEDLLFNGACCDEAVHKTYRRQ